jgi:predicted transcriptional regulator
MTESSMTAKEKVLQRLERLPDDADLNEIILDAIDRLLLLCKLERGLADIEAGRTIPHEEVLRRLSLGKSS